MFKFDIDAGKRSEHCDRYTIRYAAQDYPLGSSPEYFRGARPVVYDTSGDTPVWMGSFASERLAEVFAEAMRKRIRTMWLVVWKNKVERRLHHDLYSSEEAALMHVKEIEHNGDILIVRAQRLEWEDTLFFDLSVPFRERILNPIAINGKTLEGPLRDTPARGTEYWLLNSGYSPYEDDPLTWTGELFDRRALGEGRVFRTREARNAVQAEIVTLLRGGEV